MKKQLRVCRTGSPNLPGTNIVDMASLVRWVSLDGLEVKDMRVVATPSLDPKAAGGDIIVYPRTLTPADFLLKAKAGYYPADQPTIDALCDTLSHAVAEPLFPLLQETLV